MATSSEGQETAKDGIQVAGDRPLATGFRVAHTSVLTFETDLPPSCVNLHPSGVLHAAARGPGGAPEDLFMWVDNSLRIQEHLSRLRTRGGGPCRDVRFIPYSSRENWRRRYARAVFTGLEGAEERSPATERDADARVEDVAECQGGAPKAADEPGGESPKARDAPPGKKKRIYKRKSKLLRDDSGSFLGDADRDELHVEIWNYFRWLHAKLVALGATKEPADVVSTPRTSLAGAWEGDDAPNSKEEGEDNGAHGIEEAGTQNSSVLQGVDLTELQCVVDKMAMAFPVISNVKQEEDATGEDVMTIMRQLQEHRQQGDGYRLFSKEYKDSLPFPSS